MLSSRFSRNGYSAINRLFSTKIDSELNNVLKPIISVVQHSFPINGVPLSTNKEDIKKDLFAVVAFSGTQYKVTVDDVIVANKMERADIGKVFNLKDVLLVGNRNSTVVGRPLIPGAQVVVSVEEITRDKKVVILKVRRRKNSQRLRGYRRQLTILRVQDIILDESTAADVGL